MAILGIHVSFFRGVRVSNERVSPTILPQEGKERKTIVKAPSSGHRDSVPGSLRGEFKNKKKCACLENIGKYTISIPSRKLTYPTLGKGKSSSKCNFWGIC